MSKSPDVILIRKELCEQLCRCLAFCAWETRLNGQAVATKPDDVPHGGPYERAITATDGAEAANEYEEAYQMARRLISECGFDFDMLLPEDERAEIHFPGDEQGGR